MSYFFQRLDLLLSEWIVDSHGQHLFLLSFMLLRGGLDQSSTNFLSPIIHLATYQFIKLDAFPQPSSLGPKSQVKISENQPSSRAEIYLGADTIIQDPITYRHRLISRVRA